MSKPRTDFHCSLSGGHDELYCTGAVGSEPDTARESTLCAERLALSTHLTPFRVHTRHLVVAEQRVQHVDGLPMPVNSCMDMHEGPKSAQGALSSKIRSVHQRCSLSCTLVHAMTLPHPFHEHRHLVHLHASAHHPEKSASR